MKKTREHVLSARCWCVPRVTKVKAATRKPEAKAKPKVKSGDIQVAQAFNKPYWRVRYFDRAYTYPWRELDAEFETREDAIAAAKHAYKADHFSAKWEDA